MISSTCIILITTKLNTLTKNNKHICVDNNRPKSKYHKQNCHTVLYPSQTNINTQYYIYVYEIKYKKYTLSHIVKNIKQI